MEACLQLPSRYFPYNEELQNDLRQLYTALCNRFEYEVNGCVAYALRRGYWQFNSFYRMMCGDVREALRQPQRALQRHAAAAQRVAANAVELTRATFWETAG